MNTRETKVQKQGWVPKKERIWVIVAIIIAASIMPWELKGLLQLSLHSRQFEHTFKGFGSNARIALFFYLLSDKFLTSIAFCIKNSFYSAELT